MKESGLEAEDINAQAQREYEDFKKMLSLLGLRVTEFKNTDPRAPDSIFPDWFTTHKNDDIPEGVFILYPMRHKSR
jgi:hypothetical protein